MDFDPVRGSEQGGLRPALVVSNDIANRFGAVVTVVAITSTIPKRAYPQNVHLPASSVLQEGTIYCGQVLTISKERLRRYVGPIGPEVQRQVNAALRAHLDL